MSVTYLLVFTCRMINQSLTLAKRSGSGNSCGRRIFLYDEHLGRVGFQLFPVGLIRFQAREDKGRGG